MYSFDIFDTLITRTTATPRGIFAIMQREMMSGDKYKGINAHIRNNFYTLRFHAEELARYHNERRGIEEVTLSEIYAALSMAGGLTAEEQEMLMQLECQVEIDNVRPLPQNIARVQELLEKGEHVVLISDMYLPGAVIHSMLEKVASILAELPCYVSSELSVRKTTGNLYRKVKDVEQVAFEEWIHYGDNAFQDIEMAARLKIQTVQLEQEAFTCYEQEFLKSDANQAWYQLAAGQARYTRWLNQGATSAAKIGCSICAPIVYSYVDWLLQESLRKGIHRLYFIARDGYILRKVADILIKERKLAIQTRYLYGSRKAWRWCSLSEAHFNLRELVTWSYPFRIFTTGQLANVLELEVEEMAPFLPWAARNKETILLPESLYDIVDGLEKNPDFRRMYMEKMKEKRALAVSYLQQEIDVHDEHFAFVEVAGGGLTQGCLRQLMLGFWKEPIETFFFKLDRVKLAEGCIYDVFLPSFIKNHLVVEMIFRAPHGQTLGYEKAGEKIVPVLDKFEDDVILRHGFYDMEEAILQYTRFMIKAEGTNSGEQNLAEVVEKYLLYIAQTPDEEVLEYFASWPNNESGRETSLREYAPKLTEEDILNLFLQKMYWEDGSLYYKGSNLEYSLLRCSEEEKKLVERCQKEYSSAWGEEARKEKILADTAERERYKGAAYYPCELLEHNIVLYGAGKFGRRLYRKIKDVGKTNIITWVDKQLKADEMDYPAEVSGIDTIQEAEFEQIVIAVMKEEVAEEIKQELLAAGIPTEKIFWHRAYGYRPGGINWEEKVYHGDITQYI